MPRRAAASATLRRRVSAVMGGKPQHERPHYIAGAAQAAYAAPANQPLTIRTNQMCVGGEAAITEAAMGMKVDEVGGWLRRQHVGKRDHHEALRDDVVVIRPGPNFDWFMGNLGADQPAPPSPEQSKSSDDRCEAGDRLG